MSTQTLTIGYGASAMTSNQTNIMPFSLRNPFNERANAQAANWKVSLSKQDRRQLELGGNVWHLGSIAQARRAVQRAHIQRKHEVRHEDF